MACSTPSRNTDQTIKWLEELEILGQASQPLLPVDRLYRRQQHAATNIAQGIKHLAMHARRTDEEAAEEAAVSSRRCVSGLCPKPEADRDQQDRQRHVFVLDGARGSGKSTALNTIRTLIEKDAVVIEVPDTLLDQERPMEAILAEIERDLARRREKTKDDGIRATLDRFLNRLRQDVHVGWTLAHGEGRTALLNDTLDFKDYVRARAKYNVQGYGRVDAWHSFVKDWLKEVHGKPLLALVFDDTDLDPDAGRKTLEDIRLYLSHARIAVILAADVQMMRRTLMRRAFAQHRTFASTIETLVTKAEGVDEFFLLLAGDLDAKLRGMFQKLLPQGFRLETDGRKDLEHLFVLPDNTGPTLSELFVGQYAREAVDGAVFAEPSQSSASDGADRTDPATRRMEKRKYALQWWFANSAYSALFLVNIRALVQFAYAVYFGPDRAGRMPDFSGQADRFPRQAAEDILAVLFRYHQGSVLTRHGTGDRGLLRAVADKEVMRGWRVDGGDPIHGEGARMESRMVDYWFDVRLAAAYLEPPDWDVAEIWLPYSWNGRDLTGPDRKRARLGVAALYSDHPLPWSCLYVFQLRHLDSWSKKASEGSNYASLWDDPEDMSDQLIIAKDFLTQRNLARRSRRDFRQAVPIVQRRALQAPDDNPKGHTQSKSSVNFGGALVTSVELYSSLISILHDIKSNEGNIQRRMLAFIERSDSFYYYSSVFDVFDALEEAWFPANEKPKLRRPNTRSHFLEFLRALFHLARAQEDARRHYMSMWVSAARLATVGNDFDSVAFFQSAPNPQGDIRYRIDDGARPPAVSRMERLARHAMRLIDDKRSRRTIILHAWSLVPIVHALARIDDANIDLIPPTMRRGRSRPGAEEQPTLPDSKARKAWETVLAFLEQALKMLQAMNPPKNTVPMQATLKKIQDTVSKGDVKAKDRAAPEDSIELQDARYWCFADFADEDLFEGATDQPSIEKDIKGAIRHLKISLKAYRSTYRTLKEDTPDSRAILAIAEALQIGPVPANEILRVLRTLDPPPPEEQVPDQPIPDVP